MSDAGRSYVPGRTIILAEHDAGWPAAFDAEAARIRVALGGVLQHLHHIGSTSIPGICAKPVIDMLAVVADVARLDAMPGAMESLGYEAKGEFGIAGRRYFRKTTSSGVRTHQVHAFGEESAEIARHLDFRDYLRAHPGDARAYDALKRELVARCGAHVDAYTDAKTDFIREIDRRAAAWRASQERAWVTATDRP